MQVGLNDFSHLDVICIFGKAQLNLQSISCNVIICTDAYLYLADDLVSTYYL